LKDQSKTRMPLSRKPAVPRDRLEYPEGESPGQPPVYRGSAPDSENRSFFEVANDAIVIHDLQSFQFIDVNPKFTEMFGYTLEEMRNGGIHLLGGRNPFYKENEVLQWLQRAASGHSQIFEAESWKKTGEKVWMEVSLKRGRISGQDCLLALIRDVTDRKRAEEDLRESEQKFRTLFESSHDALLMIDENGIFDCNQKALEMYGRSSKEELIGHNPGEFSPPLQPDGRPSIATATVYLETALRDGSCFFDWIHSRPDGTKITSEVLVNRLEIGGKLVIQALIWDVGERKRAEEELRKYQERLRTLALELSLVQERERRRIAIDLHDHIGQNLAISKMKLEAVREACQDVSALEPLNEVYSLIVQTIQDARSLVFELSPPVLYELSFEAGIEWLAESIQNEHGILIECIHDRAMPPLEEDLRILLYQIVRELLLNIVKHAQASKVKVSIARQRGVILIRVEDNGVGFNPALIAHNREMRNGFGLFSIRERMNYLGGELEIESDAKSGTKSVLRVPLNQKRRRNIGRVIS
jgi:PAS domain S-box-containing protein